MDLVRSLLQKGLLDRALDLAISESFFNARSPDDIKYALKNGHDINAVNSNGNNALFGCRTLETMDTLLSHRINIHHINADRQNALFHQKNPEILKRLIELGLDTSHADTKGYTCIFEHYRNAEGLTELINAGCDINRIDNKGRNILFQPLSPEVLSITIDAGCNVNHINHAGKGFIENVYDYDMHEIILSHIDKFKRRTLHVDFCNLDSAYFLHSLSEHGFKIELNKNQFTINSYISYYRDILCALDCISDTHDVHFYRSEGGPLYRDIDKEIVKWMIRNDFHVDLTKITKHKDYDDINKYKIRRDQREISKHLKVNKNKASINKSGGRL